MRHRPVTGQTLAQGAAALREALNLGQDDEELYRRLADVYSCIRNFNELGYIAQRRLQSNPADARARLWLARALIEQRKPQEARTILLSLLPASPHTRAPDVAVTRPSSTVQTECQVQACLLLASIDGESAGGDGRAAALAWANKAVELLPRSADALLLRARLMRLPPATGTAAAMRNLQAAWPIGKVGGLSRRRPPLLVCEEWIIRPS